MSAGVPAMLDHYLQITEGRQSHWHKLMMEKEVSNGLQDTRSLSSLVTDSAAASSAWGSGRHVWNGQLNAYPDGTALRPLYDILGEQGMRRGLVTTATVTHATPAGFAVSEDSRDNEAGIAVKYLDAGIEVLVGGGNRFFAPDARRDKRDLYADFEKAGYYLARNRTEALGAPKGKKLLAVFSDGHVPYLVDREHNPELKGKVPTLAEMTKKAIELLKGSSQGFILQVEAARVDHAAHANDFAGILHDQREFDDAIQAAVEFAREDGETLVVVTSDHGNSNPGLNGAGAEYFESTAGLRTLTNMKASYEALLPELAKTTSADAVRDLLQARLSLAVTPEEAGLVLSAIQNAWALKPIDQYSLTSSALSIALSNHTHVGWSGRQHTNDFVMVSAMGPGHELWHGLTENVGYFGALLALRGLKFENPKMTFEEAKRHMDAKKERALMQAVDRHWM